MDVMFFGDNKLISALLLNGVVFSLLASVLLSVGCIATDETSSTSSSNTQPVDEHSSLPVSKTELEGDWQSFSATFATIGGSEYRFDGDSVSILTKRPVGEDKINYKIETIQEIGKFELGQNGQTKSLSVKFPNGTIRVLDYSLENGELWIWPSGNKGMSMGFRKHDFTNRQ